MANSKIENKKTNIETMENNNVFPFPQSSVPLKRNKSMLRKRKDSTHPLRQLRIKADYTLEELADLTKLSPSYLSRLEGGSRRLNEDILRKLSEALGCTPTVLLSCNSEEQGNYNNANNNYPVDLPVYRVSNINNQDIINTSGPIRWITRTSQLSGSVSAFACMIESKTWSPRYFKDECILIQPSCSLEKNCSMIIITNNDEVFIGNLMNISNENEQPIYSLKIGFSENSKEKIFSNEEVRFASKIVGCLDLA